MIIGFTHRGYLQIWRNNPNSSLATIQTGSSIQTVAANQSCPQKFFTVGSENLLLKWERKGTKRFSYTYDDVSIQDSQNQCLLATVDKRLRCIPGARTEVRDALLPPSLLLHEKNIPENASSSIQPFTGRSSTPSSLVLSRSPSSSRLSYHHKRIPTHDLFQINPDREQSFLRAIYIDSLEYLVAACEDGIIYVFGYDYKATKEFMLSTTRPSVLQADDSDKKLPIEHKLDESCLKDINCVLNSPNLKSIMTRLRGLQTTKQSDCVDGGNSPEDIEEEGENVENDNREDIETKRDQVNPTATAEDEVVKSVSHHVFGMKCHYALIEHKDSVTSLLVLPQSLHPDGRITLLTAGWDRRICIWDLQSGALLDKYRNQDSVEAEDLEKAADGAILDMVYSDKLQQFACASADWSVYVRSASVNGSKMTLIQRFIGHRGEVGVILYRPGNERCNTPENRKTGEWISGSDDCTIRIWPANGNSSSRMTLSTGGQVTCLALEPARDFLVAGIGRELKVYDLESGNLYQIYRGHMDAIRNIILLPESNEYITAGADGQIRVWLAWTGNRTQMNHQNQQSIPEFESTTRVFRKRVTNPAAAITAAVRGFIANENKSARETSRIIG